MCFLSLLFPILFGLCSRHGHQHGLFAFVPAGNLQHYQPFQAGCSGKRGWLWINPAGFLPSGRAKMENFTGLGILSFLCPSVLHVLLWDQRRGKRLLRGAVPPVSSALSQKTFVCTRPGGMGSCGAELLMQGCLVRKSALDLQGTISTFIF